LPTVGSSPFRPTPLRRPIACWRSSATFQARYGQIAIYIIGTSRSTEATMALARPLDGWVAGFVHTSSMNGIADFDPRGSGAGTSSSFTSRTPAA